MWSTHNKTKTTKFLWVLSQMFSQKNMNFKWKLFTKSQQLCIIVIMIYHFQEKKIYFKNKIHYHAYGTGDGIPL